MKTEMYILIFSFTIFMELKVATTLSPIFTISHHNTHNTIFSCWYTNLRMLFCLFSSGISNKTQYKNMIFPSFQISGMALTRKRKFYEWFNIFAITWICISELLILRGKLGWKNMLNSTVCLIGYYRKELFSSGKPFSY